MEPWARPGTTEPPSDAVHADQRSRAAAACPTTLAAAQVRAGLHGEIRQHQGRCLQPVPRPHRPPRRPAGAEGRQRHPAEGADRQTRRHPLLLGGGDRGAAAAAAARPSRPAPSCSGGEPDRHDLDRLRHRRRPAAAGRQGLPRRSLQGRAALAGRSITPAVSGPFDLGTVVVRVALNVNPETAQINAVSDAIPDVFGGVKLDLRAIDVNVDRNKFMLNPTNCAAGATSRHDQRRRRGPGQPGGVQLLRRQRAVPGDRMQQAGLQAEAVHAAVRADHAGQEPADPGDPGSARRRRQHQPHGADAAARAVPRPEPHQDGLHEAAAGRARPARRTRSTVRRKRRRRCSKAS